MPPRQTYCDDLPPTDGSWLRVIVEKPFGRDLATSGGWAVRRLGLRCGSA